MEAFLQGFNWMAWADLIWLPIAMFVVHKGQRLTAGGYILGCALMMRMMIELMEDIGYPRGIFNLMEMPLFQRGLISYSIFHVLYLLLAYFSPGSFRTVFLAASISLFFTASFVFTALMVL